MDIYIYIYIYIHLYIYIYIETHMCPGVPSEELETIIETADGKFDLRIFLRGGREHQHDPVQSRGRREPTVTKPLKS